MATKKTDTAVESPVSAVTVTAVTYRDTVYSARTVVLPDERTFPVVRGEVQVPADDAAALAWLDQHADYQRLQE